MTTCGRCRSCSTAATALLLLVADVLFVGGSAHASPRQIGAQVFAESYYATGAETRIFAPPLPQKEGAGVDNYEWIGSFLAFGDFLQAGWAPNVGCGSDIAYFHEYFYPDGHAYSPPQEFCAPSSGATVDTLPWLFAAGAV